jgi:RHS repeat-associated protein
MDVYFDNLQVIHKPGALMEETHYYPFGLQMAGISSKASGALTNKNKYQTYELNTDFDLNWNESFYRTHDPQLGRFWQPDPKAVDEISLYAAMDNNPISKTDYLGDRTRMYSDDGTYIGDINTKNGDYATVFSGDNAGAAALVMGIINKFGITNEKLLGLLENAVRGIGDNYDLASFEKFADENKSEIKTFLGHDVRDVSNVRIEDMGTHEKSSLKGKHAELYGNIVLDGNVLKVGDSKNFRTWNDFNTGYPGELPDEKNKASYIHDHPIGNNGTEIYFNYVTRDQNGKVNGGGTNQRAFAGGGPSSPDTGFAGQFKYRSVVVDRNNIYLTQGNKNIITIERKK